MDNIIETPLHYIIIIIVSKIIPFLALYSFFSIENMYLCFAEIRRYDSARCIGEILVRFSGCVGLGHFCNPAISFHISDHLDQLPKFRLYIWHGAPQFTFTTSTGWMYIETIHKKNNTASDEINAWKSCDIFHLGWSSIMHRSDPTVDLLGFV